MRFFVRSYKTGAEKKIVGKFFVAQEAVKKGMSKEGTRFTIQLMDDLENEKQSLKGNEYFKEETVASAHIEQIALKMFINADNEDREARATKLIFST